MKNTTEMMMEKLREAGVDPSKYNIEVKLTPKEEIELSKFVEDKQIDNKAFRRWITAQTFKMLEESSFNYQTKRFEHGWDAYLRNNYSYKYQFTMMLEELRVLNKLESRDKEEFEERSRFFSKRVVVATCSHYMRQLLKYIKANTNKDGYVKLSKYGKVKIEENVEPLFMTKLDENIYNIEFSESYAELYTNLKAFMSNMNKIPNSTSKCREWKDAFKGSGAYYSLKNLILYHSVILPKCSNKKESLEFLKNYTDTLNNGDFWRLHELLKETIDWNHFDLRKSIEKNK